MNIQHVVRGISSHVFGRALGCAALAVSLTFAGAVASAQASEAVVGVGLQRSEHAVKGDSYVSSKLGASAGGTLQSTNAARTTVVVATPNVDETESFEADAWVEEAPVEEAAQDWQAAPEVVEEAPAVDYWEPEYVEQPAPEQSYEEDAWVEDTWTEDISVEDTWTEDTWVEETPVEEPSVTWYTAVASAYSVETNGGTTTASGIPLDDGVLTVASPWIDLGTYIEIEYYGVTVQAQVTDRGPYVSGRDLDLSQAVVQALGFGSIYDWGVQTVNYRIL